MSVKLIKTYFIAITSVITEQRKNKNLTNTKKQNIAVTNVTTKQSEKLLLKHMLILNMKVSHRIVISVVSIQRGKQFFVDT